MTTPRNDVYAAINGERDYQDSLPSTRTDGLPHTVGDYVTMLQHYQQELVSAWTKNPGNDEALNIVRKIAGIAVHCMEDHGVIARSVRSSTPSAPSASIPAQRPRE
jgi:hypothetical protein